MKQNLLLFKEVNVRLKQVNDKFEQASNSLLFLRIQLLYNFRTRENLSFNKREIRKIVSEIRKIECYNKGLDCLV
jgi:hypothetical protein